MARYKAIETPEQFYELFEEFKTWLFANPIMKSEFSAKLGEIVEIPLQRPLTWNRFDVWCYEKGIIQDLEDYRTNTDGRYNEFKGVIKKINKEMTSNKFEGATVGIFNANIIARDLGLIDKQDVEQRTTNNDKRSLNVILTSFRKDV